MPECGAFAAAGGLMKRHGTAPHTQPTLQDGLGQHTLCRHSSRFKPNRFLLNPELQFDRGEDKDQGSRGFRASPY